MKFSLTRAALMLGWATALTGCGGAPEHQLPDPVALAQTAVMARHDSLMAQMDQLYVLKQRLRKTRATNTAPYVRGLEGADAAMMGWMHQYRAPDTTAAPEQRLAYFQAQHRQLAAVAQRFRGSIDSATAYLKQAPAASTSAAK